MMPPRGPLALDMDTGDPDEFLTLLLLLDHPRVELLAVTITPGTADQGGLVRAALGREDVVVGARDLDSPKQAVSAWHYQAHGEQPPSRDTEPADEVLVRVLGPRTTLLTGGPPKNLGPGETFASRTERQHPRCGGAATSS